ncbi:MAG: DNA mismatch repair protein MutS [Candidatus Hatepunaea meridiana]|nr:DNA mismatch repair protein MutS [Candidatus Hatepunaea meridiana]
MNIPKGERTPMIKQYLGIKQKYKDAILFYRMGDFFEMFYEDAQIASGVLGLRLTSRAHGKASKVPLAGFPHHQVDGYLTRMVEAGYRVVIVEQVEDPKLAKGLVKRDVVRIATAGTNPAAIDQDEPKSAKIGAVIRGKQDWGYAWADVATGEFYTGEFNDDDVKFISSQVDPVELVVPESHPNVPECRSLLRHTQASFDTPVRKVAEASFDTPVRELGKGAKPMLSKLVDWVWEPAFARSSLIDHFGTVGLKGFGLEQFDLAVSAAGALLYYLKGNLHSEVNHLTTISLADVSGMLFMEPSTRRNLELTESLSGNPQATLFSIINRTVTNPGKRLLYNRLLEPLADKNRIDERLEAVNEFKNQAEARSKLRALLKQAGDLQRYLARLATGRGSARDLVAIRETLGMLPEFIQLLDGIGGRLLETLWKRIGLMEELKVCLQDALVDNPPVGTSEGEMIRDGYDARVDELRTIRDSGKTWIEEFERRERKRTGIHNLKVGFNRVFGYYIEITKSHIEKAPDDYKRRQTLVNAERYIVQSLSEYEEKLLGAEDEVNSLESEIYRRLVNITLKYSRELQENAGVLAELDVTSGLAELAEAENYCRPVIESNQRIVLKDSRHPVVEKLLPPGEQFVPNDLEIGNSDSFIMLLTGPNMAGKSTYLRQIAITVILAQMGSFVPAREAKIGLVDKLFTRIGALDNLAGGESTFLVEMHETASILNNATNKSLVLFDEIGRGTSTFDGLSLAWAIVEYIHQNPRLKPRTLFATHFHEMVELEKYLPGVVNRNVAVREFKDRVVFLRKIIPGGCDRSFGIHVAQMAGLPSDVIERAREVLNNLEANDINPINAGCQPTTVDRKAPKGKQKPLPKPHKAQISLFDPMEKELRELLAGVEPDKMTPLEALKLVEDIKKLL